MARLRRALLSLHMYLGLACAPYFAIYGLSALSWNHGSEIPTPRGPTRVWEAPLAGRADGSAAERAAVVREELGLFGHLPAWQLRGEADGALSFVVNRPGRSYRIRVDASERRARVEETRFGVWGVVRGLHGMSALPGSRWSWSWQLYTDLSVASLAVAVASGLALAWPRLRRGHGLRLLLGAAAATAGLALAVWW